EMIVSLSNLAGAYYLKGDYINALRFIQHSIKSDRSPMRGNRDTNSIMNLAVLYMESGRLKSAARALYRSLKLAMDSKRFLSILESKANLCVLHQYCGDSASSTKRFFEVVKPAESNGFRHVLHSVYLTHAQNLLNSGQFDSALHLLESASIGLKVVHNQSSLDWVELQTGQVLFRLGSYDKSLALLQALSCRLAASHHRFQESMCLLSIVSNLVALGRLTECARLLSECSNKMSPQNAISLLAFRLTEAQYRASVGDAQSAKRKLLATAESARRLGY